MADLTALRARLLNDLGLPTTDGHFTTAVLDSIINEALEDVATEFDWPWLQVETTFSTVAGTQSYTPPATWTRTMWIADDKGRDLPAIQRRALTRWDSINGRPGAYSISAEKILLAPTPNAVIVMKHGYIRSEPALVLAADVPLCPYPQFIIAYAGAKAARRLGNGALFDSFQQEKKEQITRTKDNMRRTASPISIRTRSDFIL